MMKSVPEFDKVWRDWIVKCDNIFR
jgi:hypothetical protein